MSDSVIIVVLHYTFEQTGATVDVGAAAAELLVKQSQLL
jgi:hypothetical protein